MVHGGCVISARLSEPPLHGILHLWSFIFVGMCALSANNFEEMVLTITDIVRDTAATRVRKIIFDLSEPVCSQLKSFLDEDSVQVNTVAWSFLID